MKRLVYKNDDLTFQELLDMTGLSLSSIQTLFSEQSYAYDLRNKKIWAVPSVRTVMYGTETIRYRGPKTWELLSANRIKGGEISNRIEIENKILEATRM